MKPIEDSPFPNTGSREFTPSGKNAAGESNSVLVLEAKYWRGLAHKQSIPPLCPSKLCAEKSGPEFSAEFLRTQRTRLNANEWN